ncbi:glycerol-3-phosphate responsive antiterminator [Bacillus salitolerans]|uniref:Glycerol uptake operon antiterminator regulatory protein n=1 Tax=Bacillus salitolerans TaxID=1437434 RepID=A0ABW4LV74_9BACI
MKKDVFLEALRNERVIASVKEEGHLDRALISDLSILFLMTGNVGIIKKYVDTCKRQKKIALLHVDKIGGLSSDREGLEFLVNYVKPDGIISTRNTMIRLAKKMNLITVQRLFLIDTDSFKQGLESVRTNLPDAVEVMPARIPEIIYKFKQQTNIPLITGGLLETPMQIKECIENGAIAVSTGNPKLWKETVRLHETIHNLTV